MRRTVFIKKSFIMLILAASLSFLASLLTSTVTVAQQQDIVSKNWFDEELSEKRKILEAFWQNRIILYNQKSVDDFKVSIIGNHFSEDKEWNIKIEQLFQDAIAKKINFNLFFNSLKDEPLVLIDAMNDVEKLVPKDQIEDVYPHINKTNLKNLRQYIKDKNLSASITLGAKKERLVTPAFPENQSQYTFAIHSVGKVFTGILALIMIEDNIISENDLLQPVQLDDYVTQKLPLSVREQLKKVTLYQLMTHQAGLGDYLGSYGQAISQGHVPVIKQAEDFLPFVEDKTFPVGTARYSNAGILLVGLAIKHAYEKKLNRPIDYDDILQKFIIKKVGMPSFSPWKPKNGKFNLNDPIAPYIVGSPAGGYWVTAYDLAKFGQWLYKKCYSDPEFKKLIIKYGQEFYNADSQTIVHGGGIPSSMAFLSVSLKTGAILALASDQPPAQASDLKEMIQRHILSRKILNKNSELN